MEYIVTGSVPKEIRTFDIYKIANSDILNVATIKTVRLGFIPQRQAVVLNSLLTIHEKYIVTAIRLTAAECVYIVSGVRRPLFSVV